MNERIKELAIKARLLTGWPVGEVEYQKFAESIVRECIKLCEHKANKDEYDQYDMGQSVKAENIKTAIKEHFGVES